MVHFCCFLARPRRFPHRFTRRQFNTRPAALALNQFGVDLLPPSYNDILFRGVPCPPPEESVVQASRAELEKFGLDSGGLKFHLPDITPYIPPLEGRNVLEHFNRVASAQTRPYLEILKPLLATSLGPPPTNWSIRPGWTRYGFDGTVTQVEFPLERGIVFDVEVSVPTDPRAVMAVCSSHLAWYSWLSPYFLSNQGFPAHLTADTMIPLGSDSSPRLVIGHNVSYDRIRIGDEYKLKLSGTRFLDTMSMHIAYSGMTSSQRMLKQGEQKMETEHKPTWLARTSMNSLVDVHQFYCDPSKRLDKDVRNSFVKLSLEELRMDIPNLLTYCVGDVVATHEVAKVLVPAFLKSCPHPATLSGMLTMSSSYLPTNSCWTRYMEDSEAAYLRLERRMMDQLEAEVKMAVGLLKNKDYCRDPWLWDLDWKPASKNTKKRRILNSILKYDLFTEEDKFPAWFQDLAEEVNGTPFLSITTSKRVVPKILRLTWKGFPVHFDKTEKWGYLVPVSNIEEVLERIETGEITTDFPLKEYRNCLENRKSVRTTESTDIYIDQIADFSDRSLFKSTSTTDESKETGGKDIGLPGVLFCKLPHKNGPKFRVGNPLGKDFLSACGEGGALTSKIEHLAEELLKTSSQLAYWRNARDRLQEQLRVDLPELPDCVRADPAYREQEQYSAILPALVVSGTVTRRAVEKTWLTASNAREDRVGSELKTAIRSPPGYHFVGADVDSQELWLASVLGDAERGGHGSTPLGWMSLQGERAKGTDLHSKTAAAAQVTRDQAKILNYARIYGAGEQFARLLLKQFNPDLTDAQVAARARHMYEQTKGLRGYKLNEKGTWLYNFLMEGNYEDYHGGMISKKMMNILTKKMVFLNRLIKESKYITHKDKTIFCHCLTDEGRTLYGQFKGVQYQSNNIYLDDNKLREFYDYVEDRFGDSSDSDFGVLNSLVQQTIWFGGSESHTFNRLEEIAMSPFPKTPVLGASISKALDTHVIGRSYLPSRINWVVQSTAVDYLHLLLVSMQWFLTKFNIKGRFTISIHDEVRYLVESEDRYLAALALHLSNLLVRAHVVASLGLDNLPASTAFFSSVDIDTVLRKEPKSDCKTPSNPLGLLQGHGVPPGEGLDIHQVLEKLKTTQAPGLDQSHVTGSNCDSYHLMSDQL